MPRQTIRGAPIDEQIKLRNSIRRGHVLTVDLGGARGRETKGPHPCVVVSNDVLNRQESTLVVVPLTTHGGRGKPKAFEVPLKKGDGGLEHDGAAVPHQVRTIDIERVIEICGVLSDDRMDQIFDMLTWALDDQSPARDSGA